MPYIPYTDEQKQLAGSEDLPIFLRMRGEKLVHVGREFKLVYHDGYGKHDSITISGSQWYDHKNQIGGGPIEFMIREEMQNFLTNYYNNVMEDAEAPTLDLGELRTEIGSIKGIGEKRLDEIMAVIEKHLGIN